MERKWNRFLSASRRILYVSRCGAAFLFGFLVEMMLETLEPWYVMVLLLIFMVPTFVDLVGRLLEWRQRRKDRKRPGGDGNGKDRRPERLRAIDQVLYDHERALKYDSGDE